MSAGERNRIVGAALAALLAWSGVVLLLQAGLLADTAYLHEELRQLYPYHRAADPDLFAGDYLTSYISAFPQPRLYDGLTRLWVQAGGALELLHCLVPLTCWLAFLAGVGFAARQVGDRLTLVGALTIAVAQPLYLYQITSALPHAFAFPLLIWAFFALLRGSAAALAFVTVLAALLYPAMAPLTGLLLAWHLLVAERVVFRGRPLRLKSLALQTLVAGLSLWLLFDFLRGAADLGVALAPLEQVDLYPENGPDGRYAQSELNPFAYVVARALTQFHDVFDGYKLLLLLACGAFVVYGAVTLLKDRRCRPAVTAFLLCSVALILVVLLLRPYLIYRFLLYPLFSISPVLFSVGIGAVCHRWVGAGWRSGLVAAVVVAAIAATFDSVDAKKIGYGTRLGPEEVRILDFVGAQPRETVFATWPGDASALEFIPYVARRPLFVMLKAHYPSHEDHVLEMRARSDALIDAYLATEISPLERLYCLWQVDYLIVEKAQFQPGAEAPAHFAPFDTRIAVLWESRRVQDFVLHRPDPATVALETGHYQVMRLQAIAEQALGAAAETCRSA